MQNFDVVVIGAGQAGLSAAHELAKKSFTYDAATPGSRGTFVVLDAEEAPGGAWRHRGATLTMATVNHIADLPGFAAPPVTGNELAREYVPAYFAAFEHAFKLPIIRPVRVTSVHDDGGRLRIESSVGTIFARALINCTGTWTRPFVPHYPGIESFTGEQYHSKNFPGPHALADKRILVVGGGISARDHILDLLPVAHVEWATRVPPRLRNELNRGLSPEEGRDVEARVRARVEAGLRPLPVVAETGLPFTTALREALDTGVLRRREIFDRIDETGAWWKDDHSTFDVFIWATGFRAELRHLAPLQLRNHGGGVTIEGTHVARDPRIHLIGYGPSASTVGARREGRLAVRSIRKYLNRSVR